MAPVPINHQTPRADVPTSGPSITSVFVENTAELLYVEQYVPRTGDRLFIYWSGCNFHFGARGAYAGIQHKDNVIGGQRFVYNNICSIWDLADNPNESEVRLDYATEGLYSDHFGGEGTGLHTSHPMPWHLDQWYAMAIRRWFMPGESVTRMAMFMYSYTDRKWTHYMSASIPGGDIPLTGNACTGFLERYAGDALGYHGFYGQHFRMSKDGTWHKPLYYEANAGGDPHTWNAELVEQGTNVKLVAGGRFDNDQSSIRLEPNQFDGKPKVVVLPSVTLISAVYHTPANALKVGWSIPADKPPQLNHLIEVRRAAFGPVISSNTDWIPQKREAYFETGALAPGTYYVTLHITDIFNQRSAASSRMFSV
jgi:hypothetical protein